MTSGGRLQLVLASKSPRRAVLLRTLGVPFVVRASEAAEELLDGELAWSAARRLAFAKLHATPRESPDEVVLAADTVVDLEGRPMGKPLDGRDACSMLAALSNRSHRVHTAVAVGGSGRTVLGVATTLVSMRRFTSEEIEAYVATGARWTRRPAVQDEAFHTVREWQGSYTNIVGLPLELTARLLGL
ncbi:MAG: Maf family protein [Chloroflexia bacterium]